MATEVGADAYWICFIKIAGMFSLKNKSCWRDREPLVTVSLDRELFAPKRILQITEIYKNNLYESRRF